MSNSSGKIIMYEGKRKKMAEETVQKTEEQFNLGEESSNSENGKKSKQVGGAVSKKDYSIGKIIAVIVNAITALSVIVVLPYFLGSKFAQIDEKINSIKEDVAEGKEMANNIEELENMVVYDHEMFLQIASINFDEKPYNIIFKDKYEVKTKVVKNEEYLTNPSWDEEDGAIASDATSNDIIYSPEDLYNTPIITSYIDNGNEVYFYGRFNENNRWNGKCILNVYNENKLISIFEGIYDNGELFSYQRVTFKDDMWIVNKRTYQETYNSGETWTYSKTDDFVKEFTLEDVKEKQILTVDRFLKSKGTEMLSYYKGRTSGGLFNDDTGRAYYVSYFKSGEIDGISEEKVIKTLYQGCFSNGGFSDKSGDAWYITRELDTKYMYYEGSFSKGTADNNKVVDFQHGIGPESISQKLKEKGFEEYETGFFVEYGDSSGMAD